MCKHLGTLVRGTLQLGKMEVATLLTDLKGSCAGPAPSGSCSSSAPSSHSNRQSLKVLAAPQRPAVAAPAQCPVALFRFSRQVHAEEACHSRRSGLCPAARASLDPGIPLKAHCIGVCLAMGLITKSCARHAGTLPQPMLKFIKTPQLFKHACYSRALQADVQRLEHIFLGGLWTGRLLARLVQLALWVFCSAGLQCNRQG